MEMHPLMRRYLANENDEGDRVGVIEVTSMDAET